MTVTRLQGKTLDLVKCGRSQIVVRLDNGTSMRLPRAWSSLDGDPPPHTTDTIFTADALLALLDLVDALRARDRH